MSEVPADPWWKRQRRAISARLNRPHRRVPTQRYRPYIEALEDRWLPSGGLPSFLPSGVPWTGTVLTSSSFTATGGFLVTGIAGKPTGNQTVASFTTSDSGAPAGFSAFISWGDGQSSDGLIGLGAAAGTFLVAGNHAFKAQGSYQISITIHHDGDPDATVTSQANISDDPVVGFGNIKVLGGENVAFSNQLVATFTDPGGAEDLSHYSAEIDWGDHSTSAGAISFDPGTGVFSVRGNHLYREEGNYTLNITIHDVDSPDTLVSSLAAIADPAPIAAGGFTYHGVEGVASGSQVVATFTDPAGPEELSAYHAQIVWGDGTKSDGVITFADGVFTVSGAHSYADEVSQPISVIIQHKGAPLVTVESQAQVDDPAVLATGGFGIQAVEGAMSDIQVVATFTDPAGAEDTANYSATIDWGDGSQSAGAITFSDGVFSVHGSHRYAEEGNSGISVTIHHELAADAIVQSSALVSDPGINVQGGLNVLAAEGASFEGQTVATFTDLGGAEDPSHYTATIDWGDNTQSVGQITFSDGVFSVNGRHMYAEEGRYGITVTIHHEETGDVVVSSNAVVSEAAVNAQGGLTVFGVEGGRFDSQLLATFTDPGGAEDPSHYSATIDWGDQSQSAGQITFSDGIFTIQGGHTYAEQGNYPVRITIHHEQTEDVVVQSSAVVSDLSVLARGDFNVQGVEGFLVDGQIVATFTDPGGAEDTADYSATIDWGDNNQSSGQITFADGTFSVKGSHLYSEEGQHTIRVAIHHEDAPDAVTSSSAEIMDAALTEATGTNVSVVEGSTFNGALATFRDQNPLATTDDFSATIVWGDGHTSQGTIGRNDDGTFSVFGSNTYIDDGSFTGKVTIADHLGVQAATSFGASVQAISPSLSLSSDAVAQAGADFTLKLNVVEHGTDRPTSFTIDWNDGSPVQTISADTLEQIQIDANTTQFLVHHVYTDAPNFYSITASFSDEDGTHTGANSAQVTVLVPGLSDIVEGTFTLGNQGQHLTLPGVMWATYNFPATAVSTDYVKVFLGRYVGNPEGSDLPTGTPLVYTDVHLQFHVAGQPGGQVTLHFFLPAGLDPNTVVPQFFADDWTVIVPESTKSGIDSQGHNFIQITLAGDTLPTTIRLTHTVFTIAVVTPAPATETVIIPPLVLASSTASDTDSGFRTTATFVQSSQLTLSLSASPEQTSSSGGGDNRESESGGDDPLLQPLQWLLGTEQTDGMPSPQPKKAPAVQPKGNGSGADAGRQIQPDQEQRSQPSALGTELLFMPADQPAPDATSTALGESSFVAENDPLAAPVRDILFEEENLTDRTSDLALQSALAATVLFYDSKRQDEREKKSRKPLITPN
jgi:hypothetical protein